MTTTYPVTFPLGEVVLTRNAADRLSAREIADGFNRHRRRDWGDLDDEDRKSNELALERGGRLFSSYGEGERCFWIITEADRSATTILLPLDY